MPSEGIGRRRPLHTLHPNNLLASTPKHGVMPPLYWWPTDDACSVSGRWRRLAWATCHGHNRCMGWSINNWWSNTIGIPLSSSSVINTTCCGRCTTLALVESSSCTRRRRDGDSADCNNDIDITRWQHILISLRSIYYCNRNRGVLIVAVAKLWATLCATSTQT